MEQTLNTGSLESLQHGQTLLTQFRKVSNGFIEVELAEVKDARGPSAAFIFNKSDSRFSRNSARRAWQNGQPSDLEEALNVNLGDDAGWEINDNGDEVLKVNILNPRLTFEGKQYPMRVQIVETIEPNDWQAANVETAAKRKGKDGDFVMHKGNFIFSNSTIVFTKPQDVYLEADTVAIPVKTGPESMLVNVESGEILS